MRPEEHTIFDRLIRYRELWLRNKLFVDLSLNRNHLRRDHNFSFIESECQLYSLIIFCSAVSRAEMYHARSRIYMLLSLSNLSCPRIMSKSWNGNSCEQERSIDPYIKMQCIRILWMYVWCINSSKWVTFKERLMNKLRLSARQRIAAWWIFQT